MGGKKETRDTYLGVYIYKGAWLSILYTPGWKNSLISAGYAHTSEPDPDKKGSFVAGWGFFIQLSIGYRQDRTG